MHTKSCYSNLLHFCFFSLLLVWQVYDEFFCRLLRSSATLFKYLLVLLMTYSAILSNSGWILVGMLLFIAFKFLK